MVVGAIIQVRTGSTRLPRKVLAKLGGKTILDHVIKRVKAAKTIDKTILATTTKKKDNTIQRFAKRHKTGFYRGSEKNVLLRYLNAAKKYNIDTIVRITSDNPLIDPSIIDKAVKLHKKSNADMTSTQNIWKKKMTRYYPRGLSVWVIKTSSLEDVNRKKLNDSHKEHVVTYFYEHPKRYKLAYVRPVSKVNTSVSFSVDTVDDFKFITEIYARLYKKGRLIDSNEVFRLLKKEPQLLKR